MLSSLGLHSRLVLLVLVALVPVFGLFAWVASDNQKSALQLARTSLQADALLAAASQQALVDATKQLLGDIALSPSLWDSKAKACSEYLRELQRQQSAYTDLGVMGLDGRLLCHSEQARVGVDASDRLVFRQVMASRQFVIGQYGTGRNSGKSGLGFAAPVYNPAGAFSGVAFAVVGVEAFNASLADIAVPEGAQLALIDRNGTLLAARPDLAASVGSKPPDAAHAFLRAAQAGVREAPGATGEQQVYAFAPVRGGDRGALFVAVSMPRGLIAALPHTVFLFELAILLATALLGMACAWWMGKRLIVSPARAILREAEELAQGNLAARVALGAVYKGELGQLAQAFNRMAESLQLRRGELDEALNRLGREHGLLELIVNSMSEGVIAADAEGRFLLFNAAARKLFPGDETGGDMATWRQRHALATLDGRTLDTQEDRPLSRAIRGESMDDWDLLLRVPDAKDRVIRINTRPLRNETGQLVGGLVVFTDITERKLADLELARTHRALQMLSRCNEALTRVDDEADLLQQVCHLAVEVGGYRMAWVGYAQDDDARTIRPMAHAGQENGYLSTVSLTWDATQPTGQGPAGQTVRSGQASISEDIARAANHFHWHEEALRQGYRSAVFLPLRDASRTFGLLGLYSGSTEKLATDEIKLLQDMADNLAFGIGSLRARAERRRGQEAARLTAAKLREQASLLDRAQDAILVRNLDRTIRYWNKSAERLYGWTAEETLGQTMDTLMYRSPDILIAAMNQTVANDGDWTGELEQVARDGSTVSVEARWTVVRDEQGRVNGVLGINTDIRERKRSREEILRLNAGLEERVRQRTAQLQAANRELEAFSYSVSHDLRTPLSAIDGFSNLLGKDLETGSASERNKHYLARIRAGVAQMGELIDALLSLSQVSRASLRWERVDLSALATTVLDGYREHEPGRRAQVEVAPGLVAQGDPRLLQQVLDNLLGNAWKFSRHQPQTHIVFRCERGAGGETVYAVQDQGAGFDMAYSSKLFGAFERLHSVAEFAGTGIGLATVQRIVTRHGGRVWAESAPGRGATFYFTLGHAPADEL